HADMHAGAHAVGGAELRHPNEHDDAEFLRPRDIHGAEPLKDREEKCRDPVVASRGGPLRDIDRQSVAVAMDDREKDQQRGACDESRNQPLFQMVENFAEHEVPARYKNPIQQWPGASAPGHCAIYLAAIAVQLEVAFCMIAMTSLPTRPSAHCQVGAIATCQLLR